MKHKLTRPLALRDEGAKHPFRLNMPREAVALTQELVAAEEAAVTAKPNKWLNEDVSLFMLSFSAFFTAFYLFIF